MEFLRFHSFSLETCETNEELVRHTESPGADALEMQHTSVAQVHSHKYTHPKLIVSLSNKHLCPSKQAATQTELEFQKNGAAGGDRHGKKKTNKQKTEQHEMAVNNFMQIKGEQ